VRSGGRIGSRRASDQAPSTHTLWAFGAVVPHAGHHMRIARPMDARDGDQVDVIVFILVMLGFVVAGSALLAAGQPATPSFARRSPESGSVQLRQDSNAQFILIVDSCSVSVAGS
jgi:hypothetical protein